MKLIINIFMILGLILCYNCNAGISQIEKNENRKKLTILKEKLINIRKKIDKNIKNSRLNFNELNKNRKILGNENAFKHIPKDPDLLTLENEVKTKTDLSGFKILSWETTIDSENQAGRMVIDGNPSELDVEKIIFDDDILRGTIKINFNLESNKSNKLNAEKLKVWYENINKTERIIIISNINELNNVNNEQPIYKVTGEAFYFLPVKSPKILKYRFIPEELFAQNDLNNELIKSQDADIKLYVTDIKELCNDLNKMLPTLYLSLNPLIRSHIDNSRIDFLNRMLEKRKKNSIDQIIKSQLIFSPQI